MDPEYLGLAVLMVVAGGLCAAMIFLSWLLGPKKVTPYKSSAYECGVAPTGSARERFPIKFYLVAILFVLFDVEVVLLWGWIALFRNAEPAYQFFSAGAVLIYMLLWIVGDVYAIRVGAIDWDETTSLEPAKLGALKEVPAAEGAALQPAGAGR